MKDFKYLTSSNYSKRQIEDHSPILNSSNLRHSLDLKKNLKYQTRALKTANPEPNPDYSPSTQVFPYFRPRSPLSTLARSLQISKLITALNTSCESPNKPEQRVHSVFQKTHFSDLVNPHAPFKGSFLVVKKSELTGTEKKRRISNSIEITRKVRTSKTPRLETVNLKDIKDKNWLNKKYNLILHDFFTNLNKSNAIKIDKNPEVSPQFKYFIGKGNNSKLIKALMSKRQGWYRLKSEDCMQAQFIWTEWLEDSIISKLPRITSDCVAINETVCGSFYQYKQSNFKKFKVDISALGYHRVYSAKEFVQFEQNLVNPGEIQIYNKIQGNHNLSNKKELFMNLEKYCRAAGIDVFEYVPITFHVVSVDDLNMNSVEECFREMADAGNLIWIVKPGEDTNRGSGIVVCNSFEQIKREVAKSKHTSIIQKYIENPLLVNKRKFDIRVYCLITCFNGIMQAYYYNEGYLRTSSRMFSLNLNDRFIHLTNDAVQKKSEEYGKYENGNKMSYNEFQKYLDMNTTYQSSDFTESVLPKIKEIISLTIRSTCKNLNESQKNFSFEIFGYDFLIDSNLKPWLIEANTNPCFEISSSHLARIIPNMIDNAFQIALDSIFQMHNPKQIPQVLSENRFELVYHSKYS